MTNSLLDAAKDLVERARLGDQNAMGMIAAVRDSAQQGSPRAKESQQAILQYIKAHPANVGEVFTHSHIGAEAKEALQVVASRGPIVGLVALFVLGMDADTADNSLLAGSVVLANGPPLTNGRIDCIAQSIEDEDERKMFAYGVRFATNLAIKLARRLVHREGSAHVVNAGRCVGMARALQEVRLPESSISKFSPVIGWELGE